MKKLKKIGILQFALFQATLLALVGLLLGFLYSVGGLIIDVLVSFDVISSESTQGLSYGSLLALSAIIGMPLIFGVLGYLMGIVEALLYNLLYRYVGGLKIHFMD